MNKITDKQLEIWHGVRDVPLTAYEKECLVSEVISLRKEKNKLIKVSENLATWIQTYDHQWAIQYGAPRILAQYKELRQEMD